MIASDPRPRSVSSLFANIESILRRVAPRSGAALLGTRATFGRPRSPLAEFSLPLSPGGYAETLANRSGVLLAWQPAGALDEHLAAGGEAVAVVDSHDLPYRPAFGRVHSHRTIVVRAAGDTRSVEVEDPWPPAFRGLLSRDALERARHSAVPLEPHLEPIYGGRAIAGEWLRVTLAPPAPDDLGAWAEALLEELADELAWNGSDDQAAFGVDAMRGLAVQLEDDLSFESARDAALLLRAELSARIYLCTFLRAVSGWLGDAAIYRAADDYHLRLGAMALARDVLTKGLRHPRPEYRRFVLERMREAIEAEEVLLDFLYAPQQRRKCR